MALMPVEDALKRILDAVPGPLGAETVALATARGRTLAADLAATRTQPPFAASAMDGYALRAADAAAAGARLTVIGEAAAGRAFAGTVAAGTCVRIFTGAPVPEGADAVLIQEDATREGATMVVREPARPGRHIRRAGLDFAAGDSLIAAGRRLSARDIALAAAMGHSTLAVRRRPKVAIIATGDELVAPGVAPGPAQIIASNQFCIAGVVEAAGAEPVDLGLVPDRPDALDDALRIAEAADVMVTIGGASVGDHDLVRDAFAARGVMPGFWKIAMRPGKPLAFGTRPDGGGLVFGLPGNPVSAIVCAIVFLVPAIRALMGDPAAGEDPTRPGRLAVDVAENDLRRDFLRARLSQAADGVMEVTPFGAQDSSMMALLARADALLVRAPFAPPARAGEPCRYIDLAAATG